MPLYKFYGTPDRLEKLHQNGVAPDDFEAIVCRPGRRETSRSSGCPLAIGLDDQGDEIICVYELGVDGLTVYPITAYYPEA